jgi:hypothetical protein
MPSARVELDELEGKQLPDVALGAWAAFIELSAHRSSSGFGPSVLSWLDVDAWQRTTGARLCALEREWLFELDRIFLADVAADLKAKAKS